MKEFLDKAQLAGALRLFDLQFAKSLSQINGTELPELSLAAALASNCLSVGDTCVSLADVAHLDLYTNPELQPYSIDPPPLTQWRELLLAQKVVGQPDDGTPLVLDEKNRLYLGRYWNYEQSLLGSIKRLLSSVAPVVDKEVLATGLASLFKHSVKPDWQCVAAAMAVLNRFCVITGGPGTGKTYTVAAILTLLEAQPAGGKMLKVALAAPTGKAAARLTDSVHGSFQRISLETRSDYHGIEAVTLHRLLGIRPGRLTPRFNKDNPLPYDVIIIDEASMVDLPLMARTFQALSEDCRIILLGDKDQLASVESGMVLGDMCGKSKQAQFSASAVTRLAQVSGISLPVFPQSEGKVADCIVHLQKSHRSVDAGGISALATAVNLGDAEACIRHLKSTEFDNLTLLPTTSDNIADTLKSTVVPVYQAIQGLRDPQSALERMSEVCVLCALRRGRSGAEGINLRVESLLVTAGLIERSQSRDYYPGKPIMVGENSTVQNLFNGDHGVVLEDPLTNELRVHFAGEEQTRAFAPGRLPLHQTFYAMTIHKSQGSEYDTVVVILPDTDSAILSRELIYTAVTRARKNVVIIANENQLSKAVARKEQRQSGLLDALWPQLQAEPVKRRRADKPELKPDGVPVQTAMDF